jgi:lipopolysaccharide transport system permease protein
MIEEMIAIEPEIQPPASEATLPPTVTVIAPPRSWQFLNLRELWQYRELLMVLAWRDVTVRYKQTILGAAWAVLQPAMMMIVFTVFLGQMAQMDSGGVPYPVFVYAGLLPWTFFASAISSAGFSVVGNSQMVSKIYFPRLLIPMAAIAAAVVDFLIAFLLLIGLMCYWHNEIHPGFGILLVPLLLALAAMAALGVGTLLAALNVVYRDLRHIIPFLVQIWMFATPTIYMSVEAHDAAAPARAAVADSQGIDAGAATAPHARPRHAGGTSVPGWVKNVLRLNPMTDLVGFFRAAVLGGPLPWARLAMSASIIAVACVVGLMYFRRVESGFADII